VLISNYYQQPTVNTHILYLIDGKKKKIGKPSEPGMVNGFFEIKHSRMMNKPICTCHEPLYCFRKINNCTRLSFRRTAE